MTAEAVAFHEAGHVWAYHRHGLPIRYATLRPRTPSTSGVTALWRPRRVDAFVTGWIASAGPIAEAVYVMRLHPTADGCEWGDYLTCAALAGGHDDLQRSTGLLDAEDVVTAIREEIEHDWSAVAVLAEVLQVRKTVGGREAFDRLADSLRTRQTS
ncbi:MAG: hypothetical protein M3P96_11400 [Actinomycetota bacterium]|nr:hypothetical protein [Actinomycetota bacterium]